MLIDSVELRVKAGRGGDGVVRWRKEKFIPFGGPAGGDGGKGGDVYLHVIADIQALDTYKNKKDWSADSGESGKKRSMHGRDAKDLYLPVPLGSVVHNKTYDITYDCDRLGDILILHGGQGGYGNEKFKTSTNRSPEEFTKGDPGEDAVLDIDLKLIADVGLVGLPNAGKSSLITAITNSQAKIGNYAFTTLEPNLGSYKSLVIADIPGLIEGASEGKGLGDRFLKHISRTRIIFHLVSVENADVAHAYETIRKELANYDKNQAEEDKQNKLSFKKVIVILSKIDEADSKEEVEEKLQELAKVSGKPAKEILKLSLFDDNSIKYLEKELDKIIEEIKK